jgi:hypothetical protein
MGVFMKKLLGSALAGAALALASPAQATIVTTNYNVTSTAGSGTFTLDFDTNSSTYSLTALDFSLTGGALTFDTSNADVVGGGPGLVLGGDTAGVSAIDTSLGLDDFAFGFDPTQVSQGRTILYTIGSLQSFATADVTITQITGEGSVPEPATWAMMLLGFGAMGFALRRRSPATA